MSAMSCNPSNDVPPDILDDEEDESVLPAETGTEIEFDLEAHPGSVQRGTEVIRRFWATLPNAPGVYRMIDHKGDVLYVGKANSLKSRVGSYARGMAHSSRITRMVAETASMEFVTTATETEALLLEANLIKQLRPRYNVLLRDDKSLPYILLTADHLSPQILKHRGARKRKGDYFGPFASVWAVNRTINALQRAFLLRSCNDSYYENRTRPCLLFQIKRCSGPCTGEISHVEYASLADEARAFLSGKSNAVKERITAEMQAAAENLEFERAARYRDRLAALSAIQGVQGINTQSVEEADVFALDEQAGQFCVEVFFFRNFQNWGNRAYFPKADKTMSPGEVLASFVAQFYDDKPAPRLVLLSHQIEDAELMAAALSTKTVARVEIHSPQRGERRQLIDYVLRNAKEALGRRLAETASQQKLLAALAQAFGLQRIPRRVEIYDNSHIMGASAVGAMVVAGAQGLMKQHYRTFNMKAEDLKAGDDYAMMREMLQRRFARLVREAPREAAGGSHPLRGGRGKCTPRCAAAGAAGAAGGKRRGLSGVAGSRAHRRRQGTTRRRSSGARNGRRESGRSDPRRHRQGPRPRCRARDFLQGRPAAFQAAAPRPGALFRAAPSRRSASIRDRRAPGEAQARDGQKSARRDCRHRADAQTRPFASFWYRQGDPARGLRGPREGAGRQCRHCPGRLRLLP